MTTMLESLNDRLLGTDIYPIGGESDLYDFLDESEIVEDYNEFEEALEEALEEEAFDYDSLSEIDESSEYVIKGKPTRFHQDEDHELLTHLAAIRVTGITRNDRRALRIGVRRPDMVSALYHLRPDQQKRHSLRQDLCQPTSRALKQARDHLRRLYNTAVRAGYRWKSFEIIGEALHLIQDSYCKAHVDRTPKLFGKMPIKYIRHFSPNNRGKPLEHHFFGIDSRDKPMTKKGKLKPSAREAVNASVEFLHMMLRHLSKKVPKQKQIAELRMFLNKHFVLSCRHYDPSNYYLMCKLRKRSRARVPCVQVPWPFYEIENISKA